MAALLKRWLLIITLLALHLAVLIYYGVDLFDLVKFLLVIIIFTILPGLLLVNCFRLYQNDSYKFVLAAITGIVLDIILYVLISTLGWPDLIFLTAGLVVIILTLQRELWSDLRLLAALPANLETPHLIQISCLSLLFLALVVIFQYIPNPLPGGSSPIIYYIDQTWHLGNIAEIKNHWYPEDPRLAGYPLNYHIFVYIFTAFLARVSGITVTMLYFRLSTWFLLALLFVTVYFVGSRWFNNRAAGILHLITCFFLGTLLLSYPFNLFLTNLWTSPTFLLAVIITLPLLLEIKAYMQSGTKTRLGLILLLVAGLSGAKGNFFPVIFCGLFSYWFYTLLRFRNNQRINTLLVTTAVSFLMVFLYIYRGGGSEGFKIVPFEVVDYTYLSAAFAGWLGEYSDSWLSWGVVPVYIIGLLGFRLPVLVQLIKDIVKSLSDPPFESVFMVGIIAASLAAGFLLSYRGRSEYFFLFIAIICLNLLASGYLHKICKSHRSGWLQWAMAVLIVISLVDTGLTAKNLPQVIPELKATAYQPLTPRLYEALIFLRDNTDPDSLIAANRAFIYSPDDPRFFYYSAFAERRILAEGWGYMSLERQAAAQARYSDMGILYSSWDEDLAHSILNKYSIDYLIVENQINQHLWFNSGRYLKTVFENGSVEIYQTIE